MSKLLEKLKPDILVADGAMGTLLYTNGLGNCYVAYNLMHAQEIKRIHQVYIEAGADIIQTNTYGAKRHKLKAYGFEDDVKRINQEGVRLAREAAGDEVFVLGTVGASRGLKQYELTLDEIVSETLEQVNALIETKQIDGILFETYYDVEELLAVLKAVRPLTDLPIVTNLSLHEAGVVESGQPLVEIFSQLVMLGADIVGLNCHFGPYHMIKSLKQVPLFAQSYLAVYPNASLLSYVDDGNKGHYSFSQNADYFGKSAELLVAEGARIIGGCCGTTPEHIKAVKRALRGIKPIKRKLVTPLVAEADLIKASRKTDTLVDKVKNGVTIIAELDPPKTLNIDIFTKGIKALDDCGIAAITLADNSLAKTRICNLSLAALLKNEISTPFLLHLSCRDHNMIGLQSRLFGMDVLGFENILAITGDPSKMGDFPGATSVYDATSFKLIQLIKQLNKGQGYSGATTKKETNFTVGAAFNPNVKNLLRCGRLIDKKLQSGADYFITQPIFHPSIITDLSELTKDYDTPFFIGIMPITSYENAVFLHNEVPGINLSDEFLAKLEAVKENKSICQKIALEESKRLIDSALAHFNGIYLLTPFMRYDLTVELINYINDKVEQREKKGA